MPRFFGVAAADAAGNSTLAAFLPSGYSVIFPPSITTMTKAALSGPSGTIYY
jgi:hypothetical protein